MEEFKVDAIKDHDLLVKLDTKMDALTQSFQDFHSNLVTRVLKTEARLDQIDIYHASIDIKHFQENSQWVDKIKANVTLMIFLGGTVLALLGGLISSIIVRWLNI